MMWHLETLAAKIQTCVIFTMNVGHLITADYTDHLAEVSKSIPVGRFLIAWFNDCVLGKSGQIANPIIAMVDPVPYYSIRARLCLRIY